MTVKEMMETIYDVYHISSVLVDEQNDILERVGYSCEKDYFPFKWIRTEIIPEDTCIVIHPHKIAATVIKLDNKRLYLGNIFLGEKSQRNIWMTLQQYGFIGEQELNYMQNLPVMSLSNLRQLVQMTVRCLTAKMMDPMILMEDLSHIEVKVSDFEDNERQYDFTLMMEMMKLVAYGRTKELLEHLRYEKYQTMFSDLSHMKQGFVQLSVMLGLAAFKGGLGFQETNAMINDYLSQIEYLNKAEEIHDLQNEMILVMTEAVRQIHHPPLKQPLNRRIQEFVGLHLTENISFTKMAEVLHISKNYMLSQFKKEAGLSLVDYVMNMKIAEAMFLLAQGEMTVAQISAHLAFSSQSYFTQCFKKVTGFLPSDFMKKEF